MEDRPLPLDVGAFLTDESVQEMSYEEIGVYVVLLCKAWIEGSITADVARLSRQLKLDSGAFERIWSVVGKKWVPADDASRLVNRRLERARDRDPSTPHPKGATPSASPQTLHPKGSTLCSNSTAKTTTAKATTTTNREASSGQDVQLNIEITSAIPSLGKRRSVKTHEHSAECLAAFVAHIAKHHPYVKANPTRWRMFIDRMLRLDDRTREEVLDLIQWLGQDNDRSSFWRSVILSGNKLRKHYAAMQAQRAQLEQRGKRGHAAPDNDFGNGDVQL